MNYLREAYSKNRSTNTLQLQFLQITDLAPLLPILQTFSNLQTLSLHGNRLKSLPNDMSGLRALQSIDLTNNIFGSLDEVITSLQYIPNLKSLAINFKRQDQAKILQMLPNLQYLNGNPVGHLTQQPLSKSPKPPIPTLSQKDLQDVSVLFDAVMQLYKQNDLDTEQQLSDFQQMMQTVIKDLSRKIKQDKASEQYVTKVRVICAKYALNDFCWTKLISLFGVTQEKVEAVLEKIHNVHADLFKEAAELVLYKQFMTEEKEFSLHIKRKLKLYETELERMRKHRDSLLQEIAELSRQNEKYIEKLVGFGKNPNIEPPNPTFQQQYQPFQQFQQFQPFQPISPNKTPQRPSPLSRSPSSKPTLQLPESTHRPKALTLHQCLQLINQICSSKIPYDRKCRQQHHPMQTLQQYLYTYLNKKYGLKALTLQTAMSLVQGIKKYSHEDNEVAVFGKILRNELEEEFRDEQRGFRENLEEMFRTQVRNRMKKTGVELERAFAQKRELGYNLEEIEEVVRYMYNRDEAESVMEKICNLPTTTTQPPRLSTRSKPHPHLIKYSSLLHLLLDLNMRTHQKLLQPLVEQFKKLDTDSDGVINESSFRSLFYKLSSDKHKDQYEELLEEVDPGMKGKVCFSQVCHVFVSRQMLLQISLS